MFEFIDSARREFEEEFCYDAISVEVMIKELVDARKIEMEMLEKHGKAQSV